MRPLELYMEGLSAFRQPQTVDFRALDDLFAIVGPTGSGKTTILDGISLSLFGELPRANQQAQRKDFITLGATDAKLKLQFAVNDVEYLVARRLSRTRSQTVTLHRKVADAWIAECVDGGVTQVNKRIEEVVGYDYDAFTKAVVLPQGDFAQFLRGASDERRKLLSRLLDCEKYERAGALARERAKTAEHEIGVRNEMLRRDWADATEERRAEFDLEATALREKETMLRGILSDVALSKARVDVLRSESEALRKREKKLRTATDTLRNQEAEYRALADRDLATAQANESAGVALSSARTTLIRAEEAIDSAISVTGDEAALSIVQSAAQTVLQAERDLAGIAERLAAAAELSSSAQTAEGAAAKRAADAAGLLAQTTQASEAARGLVTSVAESVRIGTERTAAHAAVEQAKIDVAAATKLVADKKKKTKGATVAVAAADSALEALTIAHRAQALRSKLKVGEACPVCEHVVAHLPGHGIGHDALEAASNAVKDAKTALTKAETAERTAERSLAGFSSTLEQAELRASRLPPAPIATVGPEDLVAAQAAEGAAKIACESAAAAKQIADSEHTQRIAAVAASKTAHDSLADQKSALESRAKSAQSVITGRFKNVSAAVAAERIAGEQNALKNLRAALASARKVADTAAKEAEAAAEARAVYERAARGVRERLISIRGELLEEFSNAPTAHAANHLDDERLDAEAIAALSIACVELADQLAASAIAGDAEARNIDDTARTRLETVQPGVTEGQTRESSVSDWAMRVLGRWIEATCEEAARAENEVASLARRIEQRAKNEAEIVNMQAIASRYARIGQELRNDRFVKFVLEESFQELALRASEELRRVSNGRYSLKAEGYDFQVIDHANADECRSVVTLSGGESFLASLSLALAFATSIRDLSGDALGSRLESVFIDEGFGSLDADVLDIVADGLERVQEDRRQVGIITHVTTLAARIPSGLRVESGPSGSTVHVRG